MPTSSSARRQPAPKARSAFAQEVLAGLTAAPKRLPPKFFYDEAGCALFSRITEQPEYYPTRTEIAILEENAAAIAALFPPGAALVEFGMGSSVKARILLKAAAALKAFVPVDIAADYLAREAEALAADFPQLEVLPVAADFMQPFALPAAVEGLPRVGFFPGSTIGNLEPHEAAGFLKRLGDLVGRGAVLVVGVDLIKDPQVLNAAYNDAAGVTAAFNLNLLARINREAGADFHPEHFEHHAFFNRSRNRVEMHLASLRRQTVRVDGEAIEFRAGDTIHTENSYKYSVDSFRTLARGAGWKPLAVWTDPEKLFAVHALRRDGGPERQPR